MPITVRIAVLAAIVLAFPATAFAGTSAGQPTPTNLDTVADATQLTGLRVDLPLPNCAANAAALRRRLGPRTRSTASTSSRASDDPVLGADRPLDRLELEHLPDRARRPRRRHRPGRLGAADEHAARRERPSSSTRTRPICSSSRAASTTPTATPLDTTTFRHDLNFGQTKDPAKKAYRKALIDALRSRVRRRRAQRRHRRGEPLHDAEHHRDLGEDPRPDPRRAGAAGELQHRRPAGERTVFANSRRSQIRSQPAEQRRRPARRPRTLNPGALPADEFPGSVGTIAFGSFPSPNYEDARRRSRPSAAAPACPAVQRDRTRSSSRSSCPPGRRPRAAGRSRSSATASPTR